MEGCTAAIQSAARDATASDASIREEVRLNPTPAETSVKSRCAAVSSEDAAEARRAANDAAAIELSTFESSASLASTRG